jgi:GT2 family glycosyltransferase
MILNVLAIIITYNGERWIKQSIQSVLNSNYKVDIFIVDNASVDNTLDIIKKEFHNIEVTALTSNLGFGQANNIAINYALEKNYDYVFLMNQDAKIHENTVGFLLDGFANNKQYGVLSPIHLDWNGDYPERGFLNFLNEGIEEKWYVDAIQNKLNGIYSVKFINAAFWMIPCTVLQKVGGFDPLLPHYGEDNDWMSRMTFHGFTAGIVWNAIGNHASSYKDWSEIQYNKRRVLLTYINSVKNINATLKSNLFLFTKKEIDSIITSFLIGNFKKAYVNAYCLFQTWRLLPLINNSRKVSKENRAFLNV